MSITGLWVARAFGIVWAVPNTAVGVLAGVVGMAFGARAEWSRRDFALVFHRWPWGPGGAITFGNSILHTGDTLEAECVTYEHRAGRTRHPRIRLGDH